MAKLTNFEDEMPSTSTSKGNKGKGRAAPPQAPEAFPDNDDVVGDEDDDDAPPEAVSASKMKSALKKREKASKEGELEWVLFLFSIERCAGSTIYSVLQGSP